MSINEFERRLNKRLEEIIGKERLIRYDNWAKKNKEQAKEWAIMLDEALTRKNRKLESYLENADELTYRTYIGLKVEEYLFKSNYKYWKTQDLIFKEVGLSLYKRLLFRFLPKKKVF